MTRQTHDLKMPAFGADMATGTLIEWQIAPGDAVKRGDVIAVIETNKGAIELDIFEDTVIEALLVKVGDEVSVGTGIARLQGPGEQGEEIVPEVVGETTNEPVSVLSATTSQTDSKEVQSLEPVASTEATSPLTAGTQMTSTLVSNADLVEDTNIDTGDNFILASPAARRQARALNVDLAEIATGLCRPVSLSDLPSQKDREPQQSTKQPIQSKAKPPADDAKQLMRQAISDTVSLSKQTIPHYYLSQRLDVTALQDAVTSYNADKEADARILLAAPLMTAVARLLVRHKQLNGQFVGGQFNASSAVHLAHAVNVRGTGLIMPVIRDAQVLNTIEIMQAINRQVTEARRGRLPMSQLTGATCCVSSIGERGAEQMSAIIQPPQVAIIAMGSPHKEPLIINGQVEVRDVIIAGLSADHRVSDGHIGAKFLYQLNQLLQEPEQLWTDKNSTN